MLATAGPMRPVTGATVVNQAAAALSVLCGLGFGVPGVYGALYVASMKRSGCFWAFRPTGRDRSSTSASTSLPLLHGFVVVYAAEVGVGMLLWMNRRVGGWLSIALLPFEPAYWVGFACPSALSLAGLRTIAVVAALRRDAMR